MKDGVCVKCGSHEVYTNEGKFIRRGVNGVGALPVTFLRDAVTTAYVCGRCGYIERYLEEDGRTEVRERWRQVRYLPPSDAQP